MKDASELIRFDVENLPISIKYARLSHYDNMQMLSHWHDEVELIKAVKGTLHYNINGKAYCIAENDALLINAKQMHFGYAVNGIDCDYLCMVFSPQLLCPNSVIKAKYVDPVLALSSDAAAFQLNADVNSHQQMIALMDEAYRHWQFKKSGFELEVLGRLQLIWSRWFQMLEDTVAGNDYSPEEDLQIQRNMLEYIYRNYDAKITLTQIAQAGEVCRSHCCKIFRKYLNKTPIEFLNAYRLETSIALLRNTKLNITEIALRCGFRSPSYFSETFNKYKGCTPSSYRLLKASG